jgi:hypothetical protein
MWLGVGGGVMAGVFIIGLVVYCACWREKSKGGADTGAGRLDSVSGDQYDALSPASDDPINIKNNL